MMIEFEEVVAVPDPLPLIVLINKLPAQPNWLTVASKLTAAPPPKTPITSPLTISTTVVPLTLAEDWPLPVAMETPPPKPPMTMPSNLEGSAFLSMSMVTWEFWRTSDWETDSLAATLKPAPAKPPTLAFPVMLRTVESTDTRFVPAEGLKLPIVERTADPPKTPRLLPLTMSVVAVPVLWIACAVSVAAIMRSPPIAPKTKGLLESDPMMMCVSPTRSDIS